jgi:hypothetical protein
MFQPKEEFLVEQNVWYCTILNVPGLATNAAGAKVHGFSSLFKKRSVDQKPGRNLGQITIRYFISLCSMKVLVHVLKVKKGSNASPVQLLCCLTESGKKGAHWSCETLQSPALSAEQSSRD